MTSPDSSERSNAIAIVEMTGRFPGANGVDELWQNLLAGTESIRALTDAEMLAAGVDPALLNRPNYVRRRGTLEGVGRFDASFFGFTAREAELRDPQQRVFLECSSELLELAGYNPDSYRGRIGVYAGAAMSTYFLSRVFDSVARPDGDGARSTRF